MNVQVHIRGDQNNKDVDGKGGQVHEQGYEYSNSTVTQVSIEFVEKEERLIDTGQKTKNVREGDRGYSW